MVKVATVFSGIGAIEHALQRMELEHEIVFACDNGDVDILSKKVDIDIVEIDNEINVLKETISKINRETDEAIEYKAQLIEDFNRNKNEFNSIRARIIDIKDDDIFNIVVDVLQRILQMKNLKTARLKEYKLFVNSLGREQSNENRILLCLKYIVKIINDFKKDNELSSLDDDSVTSYKSVDNIKWENVKNELSLLLHKLEDNNGKKIIKAVRDVSERLSMLHEKISSFYILEELSKLENYEDKKKYVDNLYKGKESQNKVMASYLANYNINEKDFHWNVSFLDGKQYEGKVDLFVGGSPCQSFSLVGKQRGLEDTRGTLFYEYARLIREIKAKVFIYENVKALLSNDEGRTWETIKQVFSELNYTWKHAILNAKDFGIPQNRERVFVIGFRNDLSLVPLNELFDTIHNTPA